MTFLFAILFGSLVTTTMNGTKSYDDCKERNFEPRACKTSKVMHDLGPKEKENDSVKALASN